MMKNLGLLLVGLLLGLMLLSSTLFTVDQREYALVKRLGEVVAIKKEPGLYVKAPFVDSVVYFLALQGFLPQMDRLVSCRDNYLAASVPVYA